MSSQKNNYVLLSKTNSDTTNSDTTNINTTNNSIITLFTLIMTSAIFGALLDTWNINIRDLEAVIQAPVSLLPSVLSGLNLTTEASEALTFAWLVINKGMIGDFFPKSSVKDYHTEEYKARHKLLSDSIREIRKTDPNTLSTKNALSIMRKLWDTVSRFRAFNTSNVRAIIKYSDRPYRKKTCINKASQNKTEDAPLMTKSKNKYNSNYLDEETDDEEIQQLKFNNMFKDDYEKDIYFEVVVPELTKRAAEACGFDDELSSDEDDLDEWNAGFDAYDNASRQYTC